MGAYCKCDVVNGAVPVAAADTAFLLRGRDEPEVRHLHHDRDHAQHDSDGSRALRAVGRVRERALRRQHRIHRHLHHRVWCLRGVGFITSVGSPHLHHRVCHEVEGFA